MKKIICTFLFSIICTLAVQAQWSLGVQVGMNVSDFKPGYYGYAKNGVAAGVIGSYTCQEQWRLQTGLLFTVKGANGMTGMSGIEDMAGIDSKASLLDIDLYYLELPLTIGYKIPLSDHIYLTPEAGAFIACGIGGDAEYRTNIGQGYLLDNWNPFEKGKLDAFNRFDSGLRFGLSADVHKFNLSVNYDLGLVGLHDQLDKTDKLQSRTFSISMGYNFF